MGRSIGHEYLSLGVADSGGSRGRFRDLQSQNAPQSTAFVSLNPGNRDFDIPPYHLGSWFRWPIAIVIRRFQCTTASQRRIPSSRGQRNMECATCAHIRTTPHRGTWPQDGGCASCAVSLSAYEVDVTSNESNRSLQHVSPWIKESGVATWSSS